MFDSIRKTVLAAAVLGLFASAKAVASDDSYVREINERKANLELIRAKIEEAKALSDLAQLQYRISEEDKRINDEAAKVQSKPGDEEAAQAKEQGEAKEAPPEQSSVSLAPAPKLVAIFGTKGHLMASIRYDSGVMADVRVGDRLEGDFKVKSITSNRVVLTRDGQDVALRAYTGRSPGAAPVASRSGGGPMGARPSPSAF